MFIVLNVGRRIWVHAPLLTMTPFLLPGVVWTTLPAGINRVSHIISFQLAYHTLAFQVFLGSVVSAFYLSLPLSLHEYPYCLPPPPPSSVTLPYFSILCISLCCFMFHMCLIYTARPSKMTKRCTVCPAARPNTLQLSNSGHWNHIKSH